MPLMLTFLSYDSIKLQFTKLIPSKEIFSTIILLKSLFSIYNNKFEYKNKALDDI